MLVIETIILFGNKKDTQIKNILARVLSTHFNVNIISQQTVSLYSKNNDENSRCKNIVNIIDTNSINEVEAAGCILIVKDNANIHSLRYIDCKTNVIVNSSNTKTLARLSKSISHVYTCGFSSKDYITFSSREDDKAVVSLQRGITMATGRDCEPLEIPCNIVGSMDDYSILASTLTLILLNLFDDSRF